MEKLYPIQFCFQLLICLLGSYTLSAQLPVASFGVVTPQSCAPLQTSFVNSSHHAEQYIWTFEGGVPSTSTEENPTDIIFSQPGNPLVRLIAIQGEYADTTEFSLSVFNAPPQSYFKFDIQERTVNFQNLSERGNHYVWEFGDGSSASTEENPSHTYSDKGTYMVRLRVMNECKSETYTDVVVLYDELNLPNYTALDRIPEAETNFLPGTNLGYFPPWQDTELADIAAGNPEKGVKGVGVKTIRPLLPEYFLEEWGYDIRTDAFKHYKKLKLKDNTMIIGFPSDEHRDTTRHCPAYRSTMFANLYTPIWDEGENGTPVNDSNYLALYLWRMVHLYGDNTKFWEIWNEPGFDYTFVKGFLERGAEGNWWDNNPDPCDYKLRAPIYEYIRTLRICYEVIKTIDPDAQITLASVGYPSFMDAILRNTDNPEDGSQNEEYPYGGGAYFDVVTIHAYPHFDGSVREWEEESQTFIYQRHTDKAAEGIKRTKDAYEEVLIQYGFDGLNYPSKKYIITEIAVPRKEFGEYFGSDELQINYMLKSYISCIKNDIEAMHIYDMSESHHYDEAVSEFQLMGLYKRLFGVLPYNQEKNLQAYAYQTANELLFTTNYDLEREEALSLPEGVKGAAFLDRNGHYTYVLWARTHTDKSEEASATYTFPEHLNIQELEVRYWDHAHTNIVDTLLSSTLNLSGRPVFYTDKSNRINIKPYAEFSLSDPNICGPQQVRFNNLSSTNANEYEWYFEGGTPQSSTDFEPLVSYEEAGLFEVSLIVRNEVGADTFSIENYVGVNTSSPVADFDFELNNRVLSCVSRSQETLNHYWDFGDGRTSTAVNPSNEYTTNGFFTITLVVENACGADTLIQEIIVNGAEVLPLPQFRAENRNGCGPLTVQFFDESSSNTSEWRWYFQEGSPAYSTEQNPIVTFEQAGSYYVSLTAITGAGERTHFEANYIEVSNVSPSSFFNIAVSGFDLYCYNESVYADSYHWDFGDGNTSEERHAEHTYSENGTYTVQLITENECGRDTSSLLAIINSIPQASFTSSSSMLCTQDSITFISTATGQATRWEWEFEGGIPERSTEENPDVYYPLEGIYDVKLTVGNDLGEDVLIEEDWIEVRAVPYGDFEMIINERTVQVDLDSLVENQNYLWDFGDGFRAEGNSLQHTYAEDGTYEINLFIQNACDTLQISKNILIDITTTEIWDERKAWSIAPNPNTGNFNLAIKDFPFKVKTIVIYNSLGQQQYTCPLELSENSFFQKNIQLEAVPGLYWVVLKGEESYDTKKMIISKY